MKSTVVYEDGSVRCPKCGASVLGAASKRTGKAKGLGVGIGLVTLGAGAAAVAVTPKRVKCSGCGENLKRGGGKPQPVPGAAKPTPEQVKVPAWLGRIGSGKPDAVEMLHARMDREEAAKNGVVIPEPEVKKSWTQRMEADTERMKAERAAKKRAQVDAKAAKREAEGTVTVEIGPSEASLVAVRAALLGLPESWVHYDEHADRWARWDGKAWVWA